MVTEHSPGPGAIRSRLVESSPTQPKPARLSALDAFRGLTMAAMVVVNNPGSWEHVYPPLRHAEWHGCTPTDLIFPFFLFIVGTAMALSTASRVTPGAWKRMLRRTTVLFGLGLLLNASSMLVTRHFDLDSIRIMGVLQRIALCYAAAFVITRGLNTAGQAAIGVSLLLGHAALLLWVSVPGHATGTLSPDGNVGAWFDRAILGASHLYRGGPFDPEGLLGTMSSTVTVLIGFWVGQSLRKPGGRTGRAGLIALAGLVAVGLGWSWNIAGLPINKALWTGSYVLYTGGWAMVALAACVAIGETHAGRLAARPWEVLGNNAILLFVGSGLLARVLGAIRVGSEGPPLPLSKWIYQQVMTPIAGPMNGSLLYALVMLGAWWIVLYLLWRRGWFWRV